MHGLLVSVLDKVPKPNIRRVICKMPFLRKAKIVQKRKEEVIHFLEQLVGDKVGCSCTKLQKGTYRMPQSYNSLKSDNILKIFY